MIRQFIKKSLVKILERKNSLRTKEYDSYEEANANGEGYEAKEILDKVKNSLLKVKKGEAVYERDSVIFGDLQHNWVLMATLQRIAIEKNLQLKVIDFGGSLGSTYFYMKKVLPKEIFLTWSIVEQKHYVECGKKDFESLHLKFEYTLEESIKNNGMPDVLLLSGVLQYLKDNEAFIGHLNSFGFEYILIDRTSFIEEEKGFWIIQKVPEWIYKAEYPCYFFNFKNFIQLFPGYRLAYSFESIYDGKLFVNKKECTWKGMLLEKINKIR